MTLVGASLLMTSCFDKSAPNYQLFPNMYEPISYETYGESDVFNSPTGEKGKVSQIPPAGTIKQGFVPYEIPNTPEGYIASKNNVSPLAADQVDAEKGKELFTIYCAICHGSNLDGQGPIYTNGKFAAMPANLKDAKYLHKTIGQMYAAIKYGKNAMGSYASQLDIKQRWMIIAYIKKVQAENGGDPFTMGAVAETTPVVETTKEK